MNRLVMLIDPSLGLSRRMPTVLQLPITRIQLRTSTSTLVILPASGIELIRYILIVRRM